MMVGKCSVERHRMITSHLGILEASINLSYLGIPLFFGSPKNGHFSKLMDHLRAKLT